MSVITSLCNGEKVKIQVRPGANPRFHRSRPVPFAIRDAVEQELDKLESEGIIAKVATSDWAAPIVAVHSSSSQKRWYLMPVWRLRSNNKFRTRG